MAKRNGSTFVYRSYSFVDKDPVIDSLRTIVQREGFMKRGGLGRLATLSGVSQTAMDNWFNGPTRRPQNASIEAVSRAMGYRRAGFEHWKEIDFESALKKAREENQS